MPSSTSGIRAGRAFVELFADDSKLLRGLRRAENASRLARIALNLLKADKSRKASLKAKRMMCGWDHDYLLKILLGPPRIK